MASDVHLGRITLPAAIAPSDELGDGLEAVGAALVAAERRPRPLELSLALRGTAADADARAVGERLRRQITGLLENARARLEGMWLTFAADPLLDSYVQIGGAKLAIDDHSLVLGDYALELSDVFRVGKVGSHREARRLDMRDLTSGTVPRDIKRTRYSTDFAGTFTPATSKIRVPLPAGATNPYLPGHGLPAPLEGYVIETGAQIPAHELNAGDWNGAVVSYDLAPAARGVGDVRIWDTRTTPAPAFTAAGDRAPATYGWEEAYGPAHPFLDTVPMPVLENGTCRVRPLIAGGVRFVLALEVYSGGAGGYVEAARITPYGMGGFAPISSSIIEWTPERAVLRFVRQQFLEVYVILQRGWSAPQVEMYAPAGGGLIGMHAVINDPDPATLANSTTSTTVVGTAVAPTPTSPYLTLSAAGATWVNVAPLEAHAASLASEAVAYGAARGAVLLGTLGDHVGARFGLEPPGASAATVAAAGARLALHTMHPVRTVPTLVAR